MAKAGESVRGTSIGNVRWTICAMLFVATSINYMDRQVIALLKPTLSHAIGLTEQNYGNIIAAFQVAYAVGLLGAGRLVDKLGSRLGYTIIMATWSVAAMSHALATSALGFGFARFFLGIGEAGNFPAAIKTVADWFPRKERALATGIFNSGTALGAMIAPALIPFVALHFGWRSAFLATGILSACWIVWWYRNYRKPDDHPTLTGEELRHIYEDAAEQMGPQIPWLRLLGFRQTWGYSLAKFLTDPIWWFYLFWIPGFLDSKFHLGLSHMGLPIVVVYAMSAVGSIGGGWMPRLFDGMGFSPSAGRMTAMAICACCALPMLILTSVQGEWASVVLLGLAAAGHQGWSANLYTTASDMFPRNAVGSMTGIGGMFGSTGAVLLSLYAGRILQLTGSYKTLFFVAGSVYLIALLLLQLFAPRLRKVSLG